jgi:hypothetical protein
MALGLTGEEAAALRSSFELRDRDVPPPSELRDPDLAELLACYDPSGIEIGMVSFLTWPEAVAGGWKIGHVEADVLILDRRTGEVRVEEVIAPGHILWRCAASGGALMAALAFAAKPLADCMLDVRGSASAMIAVVDACTALAGGERYRDFYLMLLGSH